MKIKDLLKIGFNPDCKDQTAKAIAAAYWAGQADARADERSVATSRMHHFAATQGLGRYWRKAMAAQEAIIPSNERKSVQGLCEERDEIKEWEFAL